MPSASRLEAPRLGAVLLAAGRGTRMGGPGSKLTLPFGDATVVGATARALVAAGVFGEVVVVTGHEAPAVEAAVRRALGQARVTFVVNPDVSSGRSGSIAVGVRALSDAAAGVAVMLGDLPLARPETIRALAEAWGRDPSTIVRPTYDGTPGHPVLLGAAHRTALEAPGADGARGVARHAHRIAVDDAGVVTDLDTPEAYHCARVRLSRLRADRSWRLEAR